MLQNRSPKSLLLYVFITLLLSSFVSKAIPANDFILKGNINIYTSAKPGDPLYRAIGDLERDLKRVMGNSVNIKSLEEINSPGIVVVNSKENAISKTVTNWEEHHLYLHTLNNYPQVILEGADLRGAIYAVYTFSEKILGVPPLWYYSDWKPQAKSEIRLSHAFDLKYHSPQVKFRAWFPNDTDLFTPWRKLSQDNNVMWMEAALRMKLNTIEWFDDERNYGNKYSVSPTTKLINDHGLINTTHHHSPLNASLEGWEDYWKKTRGMAVPELSLANIDKLEEFWRYNVECIVRNKIDMLWVIGFRGSGDHPFWYTFKDAPESMQERGEVITKMMNKQREIVLEVTGNPQTQLRTIFYDELSDLLAKGYIHPPADTSFIWTYVATRRDHFPNKDIQQLDKNKNFNLGYYFNYQFTSTGSHLAAGEGPWKMEKNYRYVAGKSNKPFAFSVVNAGNIREFVMELSANAAMMWDFEEYSSDKFLKKFSAMYYGKRNANKAAKLYRSYYNAYWNQKKPDFEGFDRQYIFQDLRYKRAIQDIANEFKKSKNPTPLKDIGAEQEKGRTFRIVPEDNNADSQIDAIINGTTRSSKAFAKVAKQAGALHGNLNISNQSFFSDNLRQPAHYMYHLNECLLQLSKAYKTDDTSLKKDLLDKSINSLKHAEEALLVTEHGVFTKWYAGDRVFGFKNLYKVLNALKD